MMPRTIALALLAAVVGTQAYGQVSYPPVDTASLTTPTQLQAAITAATPDTCGIPMSDTLLGSAGIASRCMPRSDATRATVIQAKTTITGSDARYAISFDAAFPNVPIYADARVYGNAQPYLCTVETLTTTGASGKCYQLVATTLPTAATSLLGLVVSPFQAAGAGLSVRVVARQ